MTFKEYLSFEGQSKIPLFSVEIKVKDCEYTLISNYAIKGIEVKLIEFGIDVNGIACQYKCNARYGRCYTMDKHGNMRNPTVFTFVDRI